MRDSFVTKDGKRLRRGYTTGSCAAGAAKAAAWMLFSGKRTDAVSLMTPKGEALTLAVEDIDMGKAFVSCAVRKDSGDDPDVTNGMRIYARVERYASPAREVRIDGGTGVGRVTKAGLDQPPGAAAINSVPREMIRRAVTEVMEETGYTGGLSVVVSVPGGEEIAARTFNPRLGIEGGISILGTTGIVEPMSDAAVIDTIRVEIRVRRAAGEEYLLLTPGNYGEDFLVHAMGIRKDTALKCSNYIGDALECAADSGFAGILLVGHIGKLIKLAGGMMNTHSRFGDCRAELFAAHAALCGADTNTARRLMDSVMTDDMLAIVREAGLLERVMRSIGAKIVFHAEAKLMGKAELGVVVFSNQMGPLFETPNARTLADAIKNERKLPPRNDSGDTKIRG